MKSWIQFVTVPTGDTVGTCLVLHHDDKRYMFGHLGEGTMRACNEMTMSLRKVQNIMISGRTTRETTGGLLGILLTLADANAHGQANKAAEGKRDNVNTDVEIYGPSNLVHSVAAARKFIFRKSTPTSIRDLADVAPQIDSSGEWLPRFSDSNIDVFPMAVRPGEQDPLRATMPSAQEESDDLIRQRIINDMFNSKWRLDTLVEKSLRDVEMPAKMWTRNPTTKDLDRYLGPVPPNPEADPDLKVFVRNPWPAAMVTSLPPTTPQPDAISYIVRGRVGRGKFDPKKALALGVPKGPSFAQLAAGETIKLENGTEVKSSQVLGPSIQGGGFAVLDVPSEEYLEPLLAREEFNAAKVIAGVETYIWILGSGVSSLPALKSFIASRATVQHLISSPDHNTDQLVAHGAATSAIRLATVDKEHFPIPHFENSTTPAPSFRREAGLYTKGRTHSDLFDLPYVTLAERGLTVEIDPIRKVLPSTVIKPLETGVIIQEALSQEVIELGKEVRQSASEGPLKEELAEWRRDVPGGEAEIITLGTGSAMPSKYRNVSATLVRVPGWGSYLLDAGENTLGQLQRVYSPKELVEVLRDLRMIWISHGHADHHLGTVSVTKAWYEVVHGKDTAYLPLSRDVVEDLLEGYTRDGDAIGPKLPDERPKYLAVVGNKFLMDYLHAISQVEDFGYSHVMPMLSAAKPGAIVSKSLQVLLTRPEYWLSEVLSKSACRGLLGLQRIKTIDVEHCNGAKGLFLRWPVLQQGGSHKGPFSVAYSGDCRPSSTFARASKDATVLIHEATFDDELKGEAQAKKHSTVGEAIGVAGLMQAKSLVLTHFSQRYQKIPVLDDVWGKVEAVKAEIQTQGDNSLSTAKGSGAGEDVDEIADDAEELPEGIVQPSSANQAEGEEMDVDQDNDSSDDDWELSPMPGISAPKPSSSTNPTNIITVTSPPKPKREMPIVFAFDYMRVKVKDMPMLRAYRPAFTKLFEADIEELDERKARKRQQLADQLTPSPGKRSASMISLKSAEASNGRAGKNGNGNAKKKARGSVDEKTSS